MNEAQLEGVERKSTGILANPLLSRRSASLDLDGVGKGKAEGSLDGNDETESSIPNPQTLSTSNMDILYPLEAGAPGISSITPSIVKPSVHFAVDIDTESCTKALGMPERERQDSGGSSSSRKHRSRKEKLVCRRESPTASETNLLSLESLLSFPGAPASGITANPTPWTSTASLPQAKTKPTQNDAAKYATSATMKPPPISTKSSTNAGSTLTRVKPNVKRVSSGSGISRGGNSRKSGSKSLSTNASSGLREPTVKKKKVIEIVSPKKRRSRDHFDIVKASSDPIFVRAAPASKRFTSEPFHNPLKFSRANLHNPNNTTAFQYGFGSQPVQNPSSAGLQFSGAKQGLSGSPQKKEPEAESPSFPPAFVDDLMWVLQDAENEFGPLGRPNMSDSQSQPSTSNAQFRRGSTDVPPQFACCSTSASTSSLLAFGRRRVDSEPPGTMDFEAAPSTPTGSQSFYQDLYFSPSPNTAAGPPTGRKRYSRRRHAKVHPPFDDTNCNYQGHYCPNSRVLLSQFCEKHLGQRPATGFPRCPYMKDGKQCGSLIQNYDTYCEQHSNLIARAQYDARNSKTQPDQVGNILAKISKMFNQGLSKSTKDAVDTSASLSNIFQIVKEPEIVQELPLGNYSGDLLEELDVEGVRNANPDKRDYDALKNAGYFTTEEIIKIHINKLKKLKALYQREKELECLTQQQKLKVLGEGLEKLKQCCPRITTNPYLINTKLGLPPDYIDHQIKQYDAAKAMLQTTYKPDGQQGLLRLKMLQKTQELARQAKASGKKQHDAADMYDSDTDADSDGGDGESREKLESTRYSENKSLNLKCAYNEGYAVRACQNSPVYLSKFCLKHILSDKKQVQWIPCNRKIGPDPQDVCKTPCYRILEKYGCQLHSPLLLTKQKSLRKSEEELNVLVDPEKEEEELTLDNESHVLANLITDECLSVSHLEEVLSRLAHRGPLEMTDTSDSEETDEEVVSVGCTYE